MTTDERRRRRFATDFRIQQVQLIESGKITIQEVSKLYEVKVDSIQRWLVKFGSKPLPKPIIISDGSEINRLKELEKENKHLREIIGTQQVEIFYQKALVDLAKTKLGEDFEKK